MRVAYVLKYIVCCSSLLSAQLVTKGFPETRNALDYRLIGDLSKGFYFYDNASGAITFEVNGKQTTIYRFDQGSLMDWHVVASSKSHDIICIKALQSESHEIDTQHFVFDRTNNKISNIKVKLTRCIGHDSFGRTYFIPEAEQEDPRYETGLIRLNPPSFAMDKVAIGDQIRDAFIDNDIIYSISINKEGKQVFLKLRLSR